jgi:excisionase family DNA binding protein
MTPRLAYGLVESSQQTGLSVRSLRYLMASGRLAFVKIGRRVLIRHADLERLLKQGYCRATERLDSDEPIRPQKRKGLESHPQALEQESPRVRGESDGATS